MNKYRTLTEWRQQANQKLREATKLLSEGYTAGTTPAINIRGLHHPTLLDAVKLMTERKLASGRKPNNYSYLLREVKLFSLADQCGARYGRPVNVLAFLDNLVARRIAPKS